VLGIGGSLRSVDQLLHFTTFAQGQQQALLYCFFTMVMFGSIYYITPRLVGCEWLSSTLISMHFWGSAYGGGFIAILLVIGGVAQGFTMNDPDGTFSQTIGVLHPYPVGRTICLILVAIGHVIFALHFLLMLLRIGQPGGAPTLFASPDEESHH
jgi:cytochrome c oxidase cbb3-type subunit 1